MLKRKRSLTIVALSSALLGLVATPAIADTHQGHNGNGPYGPCYYAYGQVYQAAQAYIQASSYACGGFRLGIHHQYWINEYQGIKGWTNYAWGSVGQYSQYDAVAGPYIQAYGYATS